jgi:hypothetical protein
MSQLTDETNTREENNAPTVEVDTNKNISFLTKCWNSFKFYINLIYTTFGIYFLWICIHYFSVQLYAYYCAHPTLYGFLAAPFLAAALHCKALSWTIYNSSNIIDHMWILLGAWICSKILIRYN